MNQAEIFIVGSNGQLGTALRHKYPDAKAADIDQLDITDKVSVNGFDWSGIKIIINAAAYTNVDGAETNEGKIAAHKVNVEAVGYLADIAKQNDITFVHISTDYVFDGTQKAHTEDETFNPLNVYGQTKADGDKIVSSIPKHYILRTSWVIGEGKNFVRTMLEVGQKGTDPSVVSDQIGRLTFTNQLVEAIDFLLTNNCTYGTYNVTNDGPVASWADITRQIYKLAGLQNTVTDVSTEAYYKDKPEAAPRPLNSAMDLTKIKSVGLQLSNWQDELAEYVKKELAK